LTRKGKCDIVVIHKNIGGNKQMGNKITDDELFKIAKESAEHLGKKIKWNKNQDEIVLIDKNNKKSFIKFDVLRKI
jgi:hypothetical protein